MNADDLGISREVNEAIFSLIELGSVSSSTILANGPSFKEAVRSVGKFPQCSFGAHLNVIEFEPLSKSAAPILTKGGGMSRQLVERSALSPSFMLAVYDEFSAQITQLIEAGVPVSHLDSHQHVHTIPWLFPVVKAIQKRFGIRKIRRSRNIYSPASPISRTLKIKKAIFNCALRNIYSSRTTAGMTDLEAFLAMKAEQATRLGCIEIMVHPGARGSEAEVALLQTDWLPSLRWPARLVNFNQLGTL